MMKINYSKVIVNRETTKQGNGDQTNKQTNKQTWLLDNIIQEMMKNKQNEMSEKMGKR